MSTSGITSFAAEFRDFCEYMRASRTPDLPALIANTRGLICRVVTEFASWLANAKPPKLGRYYGCESGCIPGDRGGFKGDPGGWVGNGPETAKQRSVLYCDLWCCDTTQPVRFHYLRVMTFLNTEMHVSEDELSVYPHPKIAREIAGIFRQLSSLEYGHAPGAFPASGNLLVLFHGFSDEAAWAACLEDIIPIMCLPPRNNDFQRGVLDQGAMVRWVLFTHSYDSSTARTKWHDDAADGAQAATRDLKTTKGRNNDRQ